MSSEPVFPPKPVQRQGSQNNILEFNRYRGKLGATTASYLTDVLLSDISFQQDLKEVVEGIVFRSVFERLSEALSVSASPFDSVLIIDLVPDRVNADDLSTIEELASRIEDRSDEISFADDLE